MSGQIFEKSISSLHRILDMEYYAFNIYGFYSRDNQDSKNQLSMIIISNKELLSKS